MTGNVQPEMIFGQAIELATTQERAAFLERACPNDPVMRQQVEKLVDDYFRAGDFLEQPLAQINAPTIDQPFPDRVGTQIGPYKLREQIGEGGMGVVYLAEQTEPVRRKVALKVIRPGMASQDVIARFQAERQALAMMDHPHIARVLDGGATDDGQPYFVMELVPGPPITGYCDQQQLTVRERLQLFLPVCRAVHHAHQKGVIHRDLKPSNVLVPRIDGVPLPKVIDFGVAKAVSQKLSAQTVYTRFSQMVGTPLYMSPEQAELGVVDVDTRSDVYSLGVLLYELLTGSTPFDGESLKQAGYDEMRRSIREDQPPRPSAMVSTLEAEALSTVAERRGSGSRRLEDSLRGELDWLVMKALDKDRNLRYASASDLADDVERFLNGDPVEASPPSIGYRLRKTYRQHRALLTIGVTVFMALSIGLLIASWQAARAYENAGRERQARQQAQANLQLAIDAVADMYQGLASEWLASDQTLTPVQATYSQKAVDFYCRLLDHPEQYDLSDQQTAEMAWRTALLWRKMNKVGEACERLKPATTRFAAALAGREALASDASLELLADMYNLSGVLANELGHQETAKQAYAAAIAACEQLAQRPSAANSARIKQAFVANNLYMLHDWQGHIDLAERELRRALEIFAQLGPQVLEDAGNTGNALGFRGNLSGLLLTQGNKAEAEDVAHEALADTRRQLMDSPDDRQLREVEAYLMRQLARCFIYQRKFDQAELLLEELLPRQIAQMSITTEPPNYSYAQFMGMPNRFPGWEEPEKWSGWIRTLLMLAEVKYAVGQPVAAEILLGRAKIAANFLATLLPDTVRHQLDQANLLATIAWVLQPRHPDEAKSYAMQAARAWQDILVRYPAQATKLSERHPDQSDFEWFIEQFPEYDFRLPDFANRSDQVTSRNRIDLRAKALVMIDFQHWESAAGGLSDFLEQQRSREPYDLLTLSFALAQSGRLDEAQQRYREAMDLLGPNSPPEPLTAARQQQVAALLKEQ